MHLHNNVTILILLPMYEILCCPRLDVPISINIIVQTYFNEDLNSKTGDQGCI